MDPASDRTRYGLDRVPLAENPDAERTIIRTYLDTRAPVHMVGAGGVGMAGLAILLQGRDLPVSGCDGAETPWLDHLRQRGLPMTAGHDPAHLENPPAQWVIRTTAVPDRHPEICRAQELGMPVYHRGKVLAALCESRRTIAISGTHGKTTTSSMAAALLRSTGRRPGYVIGGRCPTLGAVADSGEEDWLVAEADESDGTLVYYRPSVAVVTNIEFDHMEHFDSADRFEACLERFAAQAGERVIYGADDERARALLASRPGTWGVGLDPEADIGAREVREDGEGSAFVLWVHGEEVGPVRLGCPGRHNIRNALAAMAVGLHAGCPVHELPGALAHYRLPDRRWERVARARGIEVISDYAHHPTEVAALVACARARRPARILVVFQPHRYTRTAALGHAFPAAFEGVDLLLLAPVYEASEAPVPGGSNQDLLRHFQRFDKVPVQATTGLDEAWEKLEATWQSGDLVLVVGAGDVDRVAGWARDALEAEHG